MPGSGTKDPFKTWNGGNSSRSRCLDGTRWFLGNNGYEWKAENAGLEEEVKLWYKNNQPQPNGCIVHQSIHYVVLKWPDLHTALSPSVTTWEQPQEQGDPEQGILCCWDRPRQSWQQELCAHYAPHSLVAILPWGGLGCTSHCSLKSTLWEAWIYFYIYVQGAGPPGFHGPLWERGNHWTIARSLMNHSHHHMMDSCWANPTFWSGRSDRTQTWAGCLVILCPVLRVHSCPVCTGLSGCPWWGTFSAQTGKLEKSWANWDMLVILPMIRHSVPMKIPLIC